jgi:hypothetical protein
LADDNTHAPRSKNTLLAGLPQHDYDNVEPYLRRISMRFKEVLHEQDEPIRDVIFPGGAVCSLVKNMEDGQVVEIAAVGREGAVGTTVFGGSDRSMSETLVQVTGGDADGDGYAMPAAAFIDEMNEGGAFSRVVLRFSYALMCQIAQTAVCNALHSQEQRGFRWVLMMHDRAGRDAFQLTDDLFGAMLVTDTLQKTRLVHMENGMLTVLNRAGLEEASCECYGLITKAYEDLTK